MATRAEISESQWERLFNSLTITDLGCWISALAEDDQGYVRFSWRGTNRLAHRCMYERYVGSIPPNLVVHHVCRQPSCVNPWHLITVTLSEHTRIHAGDFCRKGHPYSEARISKEGWRICRTCARERQRQYVARTRSEQPSPRDGGQLGMEKVA